MRLICMFVVIGAVASPISRAQETDAPKSSSRVSQPELPQSESTESESIEPDAQQQAAYDKAIVRFEQARLELADAIADLQEPFIRYVNRESRTPATKRQYLQRRTRVRQLMDEAYRRALDVTDTGVLNEALVRFITTVVQHRNNIDYYDADTFEGAAKMLDAGQNLQFLAEAGARSAIVTGRFDSAEQLYDAMTAPEEVASIDGVLYSNLDRYRRQWEAEREKREQDKANDRLPRVKLETTQGDIVVELFLDEAPTTTSNFVRLVEDGFYDGLDFYQVIEHALALTGDPSGSGSGNSGKYIVDEHQRDGARDGFRGSLVMAKLPLGGTGKFVPNSASSQFAILLLPIAAVADQQTVFGRVIEGMDVVSRLRRVDPSKEKEKGKIVLPADSIIEATVIRRPENLPEPEYFQPRFRSSTAPN